MPETSIACTVNGQQVKRTVPDHRLCRDFLREDLLLTGTKAACEDGMCGSCSVHLDGQVVKSCLLLAVELDGRSVTTIEGLASRELHPVQQAFIDNFGFQCGFCTPGVHHDGGGARSRLPGPDRRAGPGSPGGKHLPLHGLYADRAVLPRRRSPHGRRPGTRAGVIPAPVIFPATHAADAGTAGLLEHASAVDQEVLAGDVIGARTAEKCHDADHVFWPLRPFEAPA